MNYIAVDFEWNQPYAPRTEKNKDYYIKLDGEIIQIGAVKLDDDFNITDRFEANIRPVFYRKIHKMVKELTGIDQRQLNNGKDFASVLKRFVEWCGKDHIFITWGADDSRIMMQNILVHKADTSWMGKWVNAQVIYAMQKNEDNKPVSLEKAVAEFDIPLLLEAHNAMNDAIYTALVCNRLDIKRGIREYSENADLSGLKRISCGNYKMIRGAESKHHAFADKRLRELKCPHCNKNLTELKPWIKQSGDRFVAIGKCDAHGMFLGKLKFSREKDGKYTAKYMMYMADSADEQYYMNRLHSNAERARKKRKKRLAEKRRAKNIGNTAI